MDITLDNVEPSEAVVADDGGSDFSDFAIDAEDLELIDALLEEVASKQEEGPSLAVTDIEDYEAPRGLHLPKFLSQQQPQEWTTRATSTQQPTTVHNIWEENSAARKISDEGETLKDAADRYTPAELPVQPTEPDKRSPLEKFRRPPKKALSVTDLISPAWCELQYHYTLSKHGRKRRTPAMKQGSAVHKELEDEVHTTVPVEITKKEDGWGLRIWNIIQGLRTLRETGCTRELEVWGTVGGEIVNGVIDELSHTCPDPTLEEQHDRMQKGATTPPNLPEYQRSITDYFLTGAQKESGRSIGEVMQNSEPSNPESRSHIQQQRRIYITDIKTRQRTNSLPSGSSIRPTVLQLHLYHHLLENLALGNFHIRQLAERHNFDIDEPFSDSFIAQIGGLDQPGGDDVYSDSFSEEQSQGHNPPSSQDSIDLLLRHNTVSLLWELMMSHLRRTFLPGPSQSNQQSQSSLPQSTPQSLTDLPIPSSHDPTRLSPILTVEYLSPQYKHIPGTARQSLGKKAFVFSPQFLRDYLEDSLGWWRGERQARGVELQEAWKCRSCDYRDECIWIHERDQAAYEQAMERRRMRQIAGVDGDSDAVITGGNSDVDSAAATLGQNRHTVPNEARGVDQKKSEKSKRTMEWTSKV